MAFFNMTAEQIMEAVLNKAAPINNEQRLVAQIFDHIEHSIHEETAANKLITAGEIAKMLGHQGPGPVVYSTASALTEIGVLTQVDGGWKLAKTFYEKYVAFKALGVKTLPCIPEAHISYAQAFLCEVLNKEWDLQHIVAWLIFKQKSIALGELIQAVKKVAEGKTHLLTLAQDPMPELDDNVLSDAVKMSLDKLGHLGLIHRWETTPEVYSIVPDLVTALEDYKRWQVIGKEKDPSREKTPQTTKLIIEACLADKCQPDWEIFQTIAFLLMKRPQPPHTLRTLVAEQMHGLKAKHIERMMAKELQFLVDLSIIVYNEENDVWSIATPWRRTVRFNQNAMDRHRMENPDEKNDETAKSLFDVTVTIKGIPLSITSIVDFYDTVSHLLSIRPGEFEIKISLHDVEFSMDELETIAKQIEDLGVIDEARIDGRMRTRSERIREMRRGRF